jgi:tetraprenyl-beta-curcumene synthase
MVATLLRTIFRELAFGLRATSREIARWQRLAASIPDPDLRADALAALTRKRGNVHGAALFWTLPDARSADLLHSLVAWEVLADYLDCVSERGAARGIANGRQLHLALREALQPDAALSDHYRHHRSRADGGYLHALIERSRASCAGLPSYAEVQGPMLRAAKLTLVLGVNHEPDPARRDAALAAFAQRELPDACQSWFERTAGASAWLTVLAMLAAAARPRQAYGAAARGIAADAAASEAERSYAAYLRWISPVGAMLDSYSDIFEDARSGDHSYISHYGSLDLATERLSELIRRSRTEARALPHGRRHELIACCLIAFYLSKDSVREPRLAAHTRTLLGAAGPLTQLLAPALRAWRIAYGQRAA